MLSVISSPDRLNLPPGMRIPRLEQVLGFQLDQLSWDRVTEMGERQVPEDQSLDF
jgi:hypothetical protein